MRNHIALLGAIGIAWLALAAALVLLSRHAPPERGPDLSYLRERFMAINADFVWLLGTRAWLVNVGSEPNDGTGDTLKVALEKVDRNLRQIRQDEGR